MSRETLVLLPGMMCDHRLFALQIAAFQRTYDVVIGDLTTVDSIDRSVDRLLADLPDRFNLLGLSMGGIVAMAMTGRARDRVARLALLDTNHRADPPDRVAIRNAQIASVRAGRLEAVIIEEMKPRYLAAGNRGNTALLDGIVEMAVDLGAEAFINQSVALRNRVDQSDAIRGYGGPALVLCGAEDALCPPALHDDIAALLPRATRINVAGAGHITTLEAPGAVNAALAAWLAEPI